MKNYRAKKSLGLKTHFKFARAKKTLGQNFLKSQPALRKIVEVGEVKKDDVILEIGPGKGALTEKLLECAGTVVAVEKDRELFEFLKIKFAKEIEANTLMLACEDILEYNVENLGTLSYKIIANIPYNITGAILKKFLTAHPSAGGQPERMVLLVQQEVAERIVARDGKESILSISVKAYGEPKVVMKVPKRYFSPSPKVDSAVIVIKNISRKIFKENDINEDKFWQIVKMGFAHKRKKLSGNLKLLGKASQLMPFRDKRAENLTLLDWIALSRP
ncbi:ribosomal RNA small subunit methyltransferase A [Candidatus Nomurabacteria bacterium RIFCSPHIGHO2_02_FULL_42_19]|uniref:Ribosomal RNA small subunit methyltransferase A n=1 Tax=Candidatus Nomurabacteria bacterium RIFCSPHIGHO2_02_FULL_42_19 TaxID=1801756 RepID=A0A1F6W2S9_9BACT|nr:MAG: ribosomal RNA small subunit methyltransferase A [Candidatus Nomurabacteria bacterium RIFCSPHIGHO2_02_FULL_42_19]